VDVVGGGEDVVDGDVEGALGMESGDETGDEDGGRGNSKISTTFEYPLLQFVSTPPPKNILF
jgi:hypothetical protein